MGEQQDFDNPWKAAIHSHLRSFLAICFPRIEHDSVLSAIAPRCSASTCRSDHAGLPGSSKAELV
jgi:hypothetical protein